MRITVLGCGSSGGVPLIGNNWGDCDPEDPRNRRTRVSIVVEHKDITLLVDTSPDLRHQLLAANIQNISAVLYTHAHADHCHGIDDLRSVNWMTQKPIDIYASPETMKELQSRFPYIFEGKSAPDNYYKPSLIPHDIIGNFTLGDLDIVPIEQDHGYSKSLGFRFKDFAYSTDVKRLSEKAFDLLKGIKIWLVDCVRESPHPTHSHLEQTLEWIKRVNPDRAYLTHMNHTMDYKRITTKLPVGVLPAQDGMVIEC